MNKALLLLFSFLFLNLVSAQEDEQEPHDQAIDSLAQDLESQGVVIQEVTYEKKAINPLAPSKAAFYSAVLPGLGQFYNKRGAWWKIPAVYGGLATGIALYSFNNTEYNAARDAFKRRQAGFTDDQFFDLGVSLEALQSAQENFQRTRDLWLVLTIVWYSLNIIEANVTAHLAQYNVDENLAFDLQPYLNLDPVTNNPNYGMALVLKF